MTRAENETEILTAQHPFKKLPLQDFTQELQKRRKYYEKRKIDYEFQEVGLEMKEWFGGNVFWIFYRPEAELNKVKEAFKICKEKGIKKVDYLLGVLSKS